MITSVTGPPIPNSVGLLGKWVKCNKNYVLFIYTRYLYSQTRLQVRPVDGWIFTHDSSIDVKARKDVSFWGYKT